MIRITKLEIQGLRAFGAKPQTLTFTSQLAVVYGANSNGKSSLAEAVEFLLTGQIVRRELMASSQDEFADALRNAHLPQGTPSYVMAEIVGADGKPHTIRRTLKTDYGKKQDCESALEIDGKPAAESGLATLGIILSQPPLRAPVLAQHTLAYLFSARPQERSSYFKALLEVGDLGTFRGEVAAVQDEITLPAHKRIAQLEAAVAVPHAEPFLKPLLGKLPKPAQISSALSQAVAAVITADGKPVPADIDGRIALLEQILAEKRSKTFPLRAFDYKKLPPWSAPDDEVFAKLDSYIAERGKIDEETQKLTTLFREALAIPAIAAAQEAIDCPLCAAAETLTPARVAFIREKLADTSAYRDAEKGAAGAVARLAAMVESLKGAAHAALPLLLSSPSKFRRARGVRVDRIHELAGAENALLVEDWLTAIRRLGRSYVALSKALRVLHSDLALHAGDLATLKAGHALGKKFESLAGAIAAFSDALSAYALSEQALLVPLTSAVDAQTKTQGWEDLLAIARDPEGLRSDLADRAASAALQKELAQALKQIDKGNESVLDDKFAALSQGVETWWNLLRPDELSYFESVGQRPGARRTIDFKAGLAANPDRSDAKLRDAIAVFSQSQLHCLGLALFIARAIHEGAGFLVLDDPILSSDEDYRAYFNTGVIEKLYDLGMQMIVLTQDQKTFKDLGERYLHKGIGTFQIVLQNPLEGSGVTNTADDIATMLSRADTLARGGIPDLLKQSGSLVRNAAERFCKEMLVKNARAKGQAQASLTDYDGKTLGYLVPKVEPMLALDPADAGKLRAVGAAVNPANHDDAVPAKGTLKVAIGDLSGLKKAYLK